MSVVAGREVRPPLVSLRTAQPILSRALTLEEALRRRHYVAPKDNMEKAGCPFAVGISQYENKTIVLLSPTPWGRMIEVPGEGVYVLPQDKAIQLAKPGHCTPAKRLMEPPQP